MSHSLSQKLTHHLFLAMDSSNNETNHEFPLFKVYKNGRIKRYSDHFANKGQDLVPTSLDSETGAQTKAVVISPKSGV